MTQMMFQTTAAEVELPAALSDLDTQVDHQIRAFLQGDSDGRELLHGLYGDVADEPIPVRLMALFRR